MLSAGPDPSNTGNGFGDAATCPRIVRTAVIVHHRSSGVTGDIPDSMFGEFLKIW
jgi:hypothetical protein